MSLGFGEIPDTQGSGTDLPSVSGVPSPEVQLLPQLYSLPWTVTQLEPPECPGTTHALCSTVLTALFGVLVVFAMDGTSLEV